MNRREKKRMQADFLKSAGPNAATFKAMMDVLPDVAFYMKDAEGRIMALNKRNCDFCNIHDELDAVGRRSVDIFPHALAQDYVSLDKTVLRTGKPLVNQTSDHNADRSSDKHVKSIFPIYDGSGRRIGTTCLYYKAPSAQGAPDWHGILKPVTDYIQSHYQEDISSDQLATMIHTSQSNFRLQFSRIFGISPGRYITTIRLNAARKLLETTDKHLSEIAVETGFWDQSHFTKTFKHERGVTPGEYRRRHRTQAMS
ncbi:MAG: AraC family transcriptional regulator [Kiritimatiellae bacterium]|jgi:AraC-like DNA-binding protein|nr:AraC family transcriptional regulator [Kiritimatiellia bacterium]